MNFRSILSATAFGTLGVSSVIAFVPSFSTSTSINSQYQSAIASNSALHFGIPKWLDPAGNSDEGRGEDAKGEEKKIGLSGLAQLITAGMGSPFLGDFEGVDEETGKMMFSLEANNLVDEDGKSKQTSMPYFESGWVDPKDLEEERQKKENSSGGFKFW